MKTKTLTFADLPIGTTFEFASVTNTWLSTMRGPWVKISVRQYVLKESPDFRCKVGSINVAVQEVK